MNAKRVLAIFVGVGLLFGAVGLWYVWSKVTKVEERGVAISLRVQPEGEEKEQMVEELNEILDREELIAALVDDCDLVGFYKASSKDEARKWARDRSRVYFHSSGRLFIVHEARRYQRGENDKIGKRLGELFRDAAFGSPPPTS